jgi:hypothetical protein
LGQTDGGKLIINLKNVTRNVGESHESVRVRAIDTKETVTFQLKTSVIFFYVF